MAVTPTAYYRMVHKRPDQLEIATVVELCEPHLLDWLKREWSITSKSSAWPGAGCHDCRLEEKAGR